MQGIPHVTLHILILDRSHIYHQSSGTLYLRGTAVNVYLLSSSLSSSLVIGYYVSKVFSTE